MCGHRSAKSWLTFSVFLVAIECVTAFGDSKAIYPQPFDGATISTRGTELRCSAGDGATGKDLYFGERYSDVEAGTGGTFRGRVTGRYVTWLVGYPDCTLYPGGLVPGTTYYWRVDEFNGSTTQKGDVWKFKCVSPLYVDVNATGANNGSSWANAFNQLQDALAAAHSGDTIWVAEGTYRPDQGAGQIRGDRYASFKLKTNVEILGGFGGSETSTDERDWVAHQTSLSGDLGANDSMGAFDDNAYHVVVGSETDSTAVLDGFAITHGRAIYRTAYSERSWHGGGMLNESGKPTVRNCCFFANAAGNGAGMYNSSQSSPAVVNCTFIGNAAEEGGGILNTNSSSPLISACIFVANLTDDPVLGRGGAVFNLDQSRPRITKCIFIENRGRCGGAIANMDGSFPSIRDCTFIGNWANDLGGGMYCDASSAELVRCEFSRNQADEAGGGILSGRSNSLRISNCAFIENVAVSRPSPTTGRGGALCIVGTSADANNFIIDSAFLRNTAQAQYGGAVASDDAESAFVNCTFIANTAPLGGAIRSSAAGSYGTGKRMALTNCLLWGNIATTAGGGDQIAVESSADLLISFSNLQGGQSAMRVSTGGVVEWGDGMINTTPRVKDRDGRLFGNSPGNDAGNNLFRTQPGRIDPRTDLDGRPRFVDDPFAVDTGVGTPPIIDMGAYEFDPWRTEDAHCSKRGSLTVFNGDFQEDQVGWPPVIIRPFQYGPSDATLETDGESGTFEIVNSTGLRSKALKINRGNTRSTAVRAVVGDVGTAAYTKEVFYIDFQAHGLEIPETSVGSVSISVESADGKAALRLRLYGNAYYVAERATASTPGTYTRLAGSYNPSRAHAVHIELDMAARRYSIWVDCQLLRSDALLLTDDFTDVRFLGFSTTPKILEGFASTYIVDDLLITKQPVAAR